MNPSLLTVIAASQLIAVAAAQWAPINPPNQPSGRAGAVMGCDLPGNRMLMFGGEFSNEFWALANGAWTQLQPATLPPPRRNANVAFDWLTGTAVLYGGHGGTRYALDETWLWDGTTWTAVSGGTTPGGLARHGLAHDPLRQTTVLFGGHYDSWFPNQASNATWEYANGVWSQNVPPVSPSARIDAAMCFHPGMAQVFLFGGEDSQGNGLDDSWVYDGLTWTQLSVAGVRPSPRTAARIAGDPVRNLCFLFGGFDLGQQQILNDTWEHDGTSWRQVTNHDTILPARRDLAMAFDFARGRVVAFGGETQNSALRTDTWEYGAHWLSFGSGCAGTAGVPKLTGGTLPRLGQTCDAALTNLPTASALALVAVGLSRQQWALGTLPAPLTGFGMPGCRAYASADVFTAIGTSGGAGQWSWAVPPVAVFVGQEFHLQGLVLDPGTNQAGATVTDAATMIVGW